MLQQFVKHKAFHREASTSFFLEQDNKKLLPSAFAGITLPSNFNFVDLLSKLASRIQSELPAHIAADQHTVYLVDRPVQELVGLRGQNEVRVPLTLGMAGDCATTGQV